MDREQALERIIAERADFPPGVTMEMVAAGLVAWDKAHGEGVRSWPEMLGRVYLAMWAKDSTHPHT